MILAGNDRATANGKRDVMDATAFAALIAWRSAQYAACGHRRDALVDRCDALLAAGPVPSPAHLSLLAAHPLADGEAIYTVDTSVWMRLYAGGTETSPTRPPLTTTSGSSINSARPARVYAPSCHVVFVTEIGAGSPLP